MAFNSNNDKSLFPYVMVVEYLESSMSKDLLVKFPDNSAFDFDYTQSSIWSPLVPRSASSLSDSVEGLEVSRKLSYDGNCHVGLLENTKKVVANIKRKFADVVFDNMPKCRNMKRSKRRKSFGSSHRLNLNPSSPTPKKAWGKVMKAATKHFKKQSKKKDIANVHLELFSNFWIDRDL